jgi:hypothetical protein
MTEGESLFKVGKTYVVLRDETTLSERFIKGERLAFWSYTYSFYDGLHTWFFRDKQQKVRRWDHPEIDLAARDALFSRAVPSQKQPSRLDPTHALLDSATRGDAEGMRVALREGIPSAKARRQAFELACYARSESCVAQIAYIPVVDADERGELLLHAAESGFTLGVQLLLDVGVSVNVTDNLGQTALLHAASNGDRELVDLLLARGADPSMRTISGRTSLDAARSACKEAVVLRLERAVRKARAHQEEA